MKEFPQKIEIANGLRMDENSPPDSGGLVRCINLRPTKLGLEAIISPVENISTEIDWPFPTLYIGKKHNYLATTEKIYEVESDWSLTEKISVSTTTPWKVVDFFDYVIFTNGVTTIVSDPSTDVFSSGTTPLICRDLCDYRGQIIAAEEGGDEGKISWSKIGYADFTIDRWNTAGEIYFPYQGNVYHPKVLGPFIVCYGENGVMAMSGIKNPVAGFEFKDLGMVGVEEDSVVGDDTRHYFISSDGSLYVTLFDNNGIRIERLGYDEFFTNLLGSDIGSTWDALNKEAYLCSDQDRYIITESGVGEVSRSYTSGSTLDGDLVVMAMEEEGDYCEFETHDVAMSLRAVKQSKVLEVEYECGDGDIAEGGVKSKVMRSGEWWDDEWAPLNEMGWLIRPVSGIKFRYKFRVPYNEKVRISESMARWQLDDKRAIRGVYR